MGKEHHDRVPHNHNTILKCAKVKNPCKICLGPVTQKNGLQCQGICGSWVHFSCLHFTPGKIKDIKAGLLTITCPCPDCETTEEREYYKDNSYTCEKAACPARLPPVCENTNCNAKQNSASGTRSSDSSLKQSIGECIEITGDGARAGSLRIDIDQVVNTVGQLTEQINILMNKLKDTINAQNMGSPPHSTQEGPRGLCPKPCYCAENSCSSGKGGKCKKK